LISLYMLLAFSSSGRGEQISSAQPKDWASSLQLPEAKDNNPDEHIVEVNLEARVAAVKIGERQVEAWTYDGGLPGPLIRARVGDRLIVHFTNHLPDATTVHWHGVRVPIQMDGVPAISQMEVLPGQTFNYDFVLPDAGLFWYHPHVQSAMQVGFGLSGPLLVEDPAERVGVADELVLVLNDIELDEQGGLGSPESGGTTGMAFGREGNVTLVNGRVNPTLTVRAGATQRWRIVNTAKTVYFNLDLRGHGVFTKIGVDGGLQEYPTQEELVLLAPGERVDVLVSPSGKPGTKIPVVSELFNRGYGSIEYRLPETVFQIEFANLPARPATLLPKIQRSIEPLRTAGATPVKLNLDIIQRQRDRAFEYQINGMPFWKAKPIRAKVGETQIWTVTNNTVWSHPMHIHGFFFQVLDKNAEPVRPLAWKDTVNVQFKQTLQLLVRFDDRPGSWMVHCHILDHAEGGLMTTIQLGDVAPTTHAHEPE
jgi:FtsP/CotA-like multicopper oxidase with cupredoxin domain